MQGWRGGDCDEVGCSLLDHFVEVGEAGANAELVAEGIEPVFEQVAEPDDLGARVGVVDTGGGGAARAAAQDGDAVGAHRVSLVT